MQRRRAGWVGPVAVAGSPGHAGPVHGRPDHCHPLCDWQRCRHGYIGGRHLARPKTKPGPRIGRRFAVHYKPANSMSSPAAVLDRPTGDRRDASPTLAVIVAAVVLAAHAPLLYLHFQQLWLKPHYQLFPVVLIGAFALLWPLKSFSLNVSGTPTCRAAASPGRRADRRRCRG